jgi:hypothetical protein
MLTTQAEAKDVTLVEREVRWVATGIWRAPGQTRNGRNYRGASWRPASPFVRVCGAYPDQAELSWILYNPLKKSVAAAAVAA